MMLLHHSNIGREQARIKLAQKRMDGHVDTNIKAQLVDECFSTLFFALSFSRSSPFLCHTLPDTSPCYHHTPSRASFPPCSSALRPLLLFFLGHIGCKLLFV